jgi:hypothetical protein
MALGGSTALRGRSLPDACEDEAGANVRCSIISSRCSRVLVDLGVPKAKIGEILLEGARGQVLKG